ncbi:MAG: hypothetical protein QG602_4053 [Verrucomicrobiota bacterium]|nr:hypothetical protein [Verrucomicrobiota bacterium]
MKRNLPAAALLAALATASALFAFEAGGFAFTKRIETKLLAEPKALAEAAGTLPFGRQVKIEETQGAWLRVSEGDTAGWVFKGNLALTKPAEIKGLDGLGLSASQTSATAAARGLSTIVNEYAAARSLASAQGDLEWVIGECASLTTEEVDAYLQAQKKGEYQ